MIGRSVCNLTGPAAAANIGPMTDSVNIRPCKVRILPSPPRTNVLFRGQGELPGHAAY